MSEKQEQSLTGQRSVGLYRGLVALRIHHDRMIWSRVQILIAVQGAITAGAYAVGDHRLAAGAFLGGGLLAFVIYELVTKDQMDRDVNRQVIDAFSEEFLPDEVKQRLQQQGQRQPFVRLSAPPPKWRPFLRGRYLIRLVIWAFIVSDLVLALLHMLGVAPVLLAGK